MYRWALRARFSGRSSVACSFELMSIAMRRESSARLSITGIRITGKPCFFRRLLASRVALVRFRPSMTSTLSVSGLRRPRSGFRTPCGVLPSGAYMMLRTSSSLTGVFTRSS